MTIKLQREAYVNSLDQLITTSCILAGFAFSGLIGLPGMDKELFGRIVDYFRGDFNLGFYCAFYFLFYATLCFFSTIMIVLVYKIGSFTIPINKLRRVYLVANIVFSMAIASLMMSVIVFAIPNTGGLLFSIFFGIILAGSFIWENMSSRQREKREKQLASESNLSSHPPVQPEAAIADAAPTELPKTN